MLKWIRKPFTFLGRILNVIAGIGSWKVSDYEKIIYFAVLENISDEKAKEAYRDQFNMIVYVKRVVEKRLVSFYYSEKPDYLKIMPNGVNLVQDEWSGGHFLATVTIKQNDIHNEAVLILNGGYLNDMQFQISPKHLIDKDFEITHVQIGGMMKEYTEEIDREEHGDSYD